MAIIGGIICIIGGAFMLLGALGLVRMPDVFNRIQAGTKASTLGFIALIVGLIFIRPEWWSKLLLIGAFVLLTNPIGSHAIARAAHAGGEDRRLDGPDRLAEDDDSIGDGSAANVTGPRGTKEGGGE